MSIATQHGYLVITDISGYTSFVAQTELEHSHEILSELLGLLVDKFKPLMTSPKLEGDSVFACAGEERIMRGETLPEFLENIHVVFRDRQISMRRATTCTWLACENIPTLDLKLMAPPGDYIVQHVGEIRELVGSDVNLIHRLTKNHMANETGWRAYLMLAEACLGHLNLDLANTHPRTESYEHLGEGKTHSLDLRRRGMHGSAGDRPFGRGDIGASNHCAHGGGLSTKVTVDWHPFEDSTTESYDRGRKMLTETGRYDGMLVDTARLAAEQYQAEAVAE